MEYAGVSWQDKVLLLREQFQKDKVDAMVITEHDELAWLFNLRGEGIYIQPIDTNTWAILNPRKTGSVST